MRTLHYTNPEGGVEFGIDRTEAANVARVAWVRLNDCTLFCRLENEQMNSPKNEKGLLIVASHRDVRRKSRNIPRKSGENT